MPQTRATKSRPTEARVTFADNSPSNTTPATNNSSNIETTLSRSAMDTAEDLRHTDTVNQIVSKK